MRPSRPTAHRHRRSLQRGQRSPFGRPPRWKTLFTLTHASSTRRRPFPAPRRRRRRRLPKIPSFRSSSRVHRPRPLGPRRAASSRVSAAAVPSPLSLFLLRTFYPPLSAQQRRHHRAIRTKRIAAAAGLGRQWVRRALCVFGMPKTPPPRATAPPRPKPMMRPFPNFLPPKSPRIQRLRGRKRSETTKVSEGEPSI